MNKAYSWYVVKRESFDPNDHQTWASIGGPASPTRRLFETREAAVADFSRWLKDVGRSEVFDGVAYNGEWSEVWLDDLISTGSFEKILGDDRYSWTVTINFVIWEYVIG